MTPNTCQWHERMQSLRGRCQTERAALLRRSEQLASPLQPPTPQESLHVEKSDTSGPIITKPNYETSEMHASLCVSEGARGAVKEDTPWLEDWERVWKLIYHSFMSNLLPNIWCIKFLKYGDLPPSHYCNITQNKNSAVWQQQHHPGLWNEEMIHPYFRNQTFKTQCSL